MRIVLGARLPDSTLEAWCHHLVHDPEPIYLLESDLPLLPETTAPLTRAVFNQGVGDGPGWLDIYGPWFVTREAQMVWPAFAAEFRQLSPERQIALSRRQWELGRQNIWDWSWVERVLAPWPEALPTLVRDRFETTEGVKIALRHDAWWVLPEGARHAWLVAFAEGEAMGTCQANTLNPEAWSRFPALRSLAGTFADRSGPNCMAASLAILQPDLDLAQGIAQRWLWADEFEASLVAMGYRRVSWAPDTAGEDQAAPPPGSVLAWADQSGTLQHAFTLLGDGLAFNKQSQCWWSPRQILPVAELCQNWVADGLTPVLFSLEGDTLSVE